jgi:hypothetical protein
VPAAVESVAVPAGSVPVPVGPALVPVLAGGAAEVALEDALVPQATRASVISSPTAAPAPKRTD